MSFYDRASLQDILAQGQYGQPGMGMGQAVASIPPSGYSQMAASDPGFVGRVTARMQSLLEDDPRSQQLPDEAYGRESSFGRTNQGIPDDETSAMDVATAILKTPFAALNTVRDTVQDTLGVGGARYRQQQRDEVEALRHLPQRQREVLGIDGISGISTPGMAAGETSGTAGAPSSLGQNVGSTMKGYVEWANNLGRDRAQQTMNQVRATIKAQYMAGKLTLQELQNLNQMLDGQRTAADIGRINAVTEGQVRENAWIDPQNRATLGVKGSQIGANNAQAGLYNANRQTEDEMRAARVAEQQGKAWKADAEARGVESNIFYMAGKDQATIDKTRQEIKRDETLLPYDVQKQRAATNADIALANQRSGVNAGGSGNMGENSASASIAKTGLETKKALAELTLGNGENGRPAMDKEEAYELFGVPKTVEDGWLWDSTTYDTRAWDPTAEARASLKSADRQAERDAIPLLPMPGLGETVSAATPSTARPTGDAIYAVTQILRKGDPTANAGDQVQFAEELARLLSSADLSSDTAFARSVVKSPTNPNGVPKEIARAYWKGLQASK